MPLLLLPGTLCDERVFAPLQKHLEKVRTRVVLTLEARTLQQAAEQVLVQVPGRFAVLGFSLGGMVAMELALLAPERVCGLALLSTTPLPVAEERVAGRRAAVDEARCMPMSRFVRELLWPDYGGPPTDADTLPLLVQMAEALGPDTFARQTEMALLRKDFCARLPAVTCPSLVIAGTADVLCPPAVQQRLTAALAGCTSVVLQHVGHFALLEQADEVAQVVAAWFHAVQHGPVCAGD